MNVEDPSDEELQAAANNMSTSTNNTIDVTSSSTGTDDIQQHKSTSIDDTTESSGSVEKLMREQLELVRRLTNAQIEQKKELDRVEQEKRQLEEKQRKQAEVAAAAAAAPQCSQASIPPNLPRNSPHGLVSDTQQSMSSRFFYRAPSVKQYPQHHPDSRYYYNDSNNRSSNESATTTSGNPSMASIANPPVTSPGILRNSRERMRIAYIPERDIVSEPENTCLTSFWRSLWWIFCRLCTLSRPGVRSLQYPS
jgi:hypothetical protein